MCYMLPYKRKIATFPAIEVDLVEEFGIALKFLHEFMYRQVGRRESLGYKKLIRKITFDQRGKKVMVYEEAESLLKYFLDQMIKFPTFFYSTQLDNKDHITNIF